MSPNNHKQHLYPTRIDMPAETRSQIVGLLNATLATTLDLKTQVKQAHWNVKGMDFYQLHLLFDEMATELEDYSILPEFPFDILDGKEYVTALADRYAPYAKHLRVAIDKTGELGDADTADLYTEISRTIDKRLWFLEAHLQAAATTTASATPEKVAL
ncbi:MAG: DNA starvation/stationary phase protection protein Dps [Oscillatoriales cyanobacterium]|nr:MAG: DNA starvation/stationary phase protection protein Dps [Oscillatoriales cyanobacterium]